jgi:hypothetical protein
MPFFQHFQGNLSRMLHRLGMQLRWGTWERNTGGLWSAEVHSDDDKCCQTRWQVTTIYEMIWHWACFSNIFGFFFLLNKPCKINILYYTIIFYYIYGSKLFIFYKTKNLGLLLLLLPLAYTLCNELLFFLSISYLVPSLSQVASSKVAVCTTLKPFYEHLVFTVWTSWSA